jgi:hypothetical protein
LIEIGTLHPASVIIVAVILLGTTGVIRAMATTLGKEIGWRGFCIYELRKVVCFKRVSVLDKLHANLIVHFLMEKIANSHG